MLREKPGRYADAIDKATLVSKHLLISPGETCYRIVVTRQQKQRIVADRTLLGKGRWDAADALTKHHFLIGTINLFPVSCRKSLELCGCIEISRNVGVQEPGTSRSVYLHNNHTSPAFPEKLGVCNELICLCSLFSVLNN